MIEELKDIEEISTYGFGIANANGVKCECEKHTRKPNVTEIQTKINEIIKYLNKKETEDER